MLESSKGVIPPWESENRERQIQALIDGSGEDRELLEKYIKLPNQPNIQPEVMRLVMDYGDKFSVVSDKIGELGQELGMSFDELRSAILDRLEK